MRRIVQFPAGTSHSIFPSFDILAVRSMMLSLAIAVVGRDDPIAPDGGLGTSRPTIGIASLVGRDDPIAPDGGLGTSRPTIGIASLVGRVIPNAPSVSRLKPLRSNPIFALRSVSDAPFAGVGYASTAMSS